jgi:4-oxalocrotonate tautomerase
MPIIEISLVQGRPRDRMPILIKQMTDVVEETLGLPRETIRVIIREVPPELWGVAGVTKALLNGRGDERS